MSSKRVPHQVDADGSNLLGEEQFSQLCAGLFGGPAGCVEAVTGGTVSIESLPLASPRGLVLSLSFLWPPAKQYATFFHLTSLNPFIFNQCLRAGAPVVGNFLRMRGN